MRLVVIGMLLYVASVFPMSIVHSGEEALEVNGIPRVLPSPFHYFVKNLTYRFLPPRKNQMLIVTRDAEDVLKIAKTIADKHDMACIRVNLSIDFYEKTASYFWEIFNEAKELAKLQGRKVLLVFYHAEELVDKNLIFQNKTGYYAGNFARFLEKFKYDAHIAVMIHCNELDIIMHDLRYYFEYEATITNPDQESQKLIFKKRFQENNILIDDNVLHHLVRYIAGKTWSETEHVAQKLGYYAKQSGNVVSPQVIRTSFPDFKTPYERVQYYIDGVLELRSSMLGDRFFWAGGALITCIYLSEKDKKTKTKREQNNDSKDQGVVVV